MATGQGDYPVTPGAARNPSAPPPYPEGASSADIRDDIRRTRAEMDETVDTLTERLRPRHLLDDLLDLFRGNSGSGGSGAGGSAADDVKEKAKQYGSSLLRSLKNHPVPAALIGAGVAWLIVDQTTDGDGPSRRRAPGRWRDDELTEHSGSFVDARTGRPYDDSYGRDFRAGSGKSTSGESGGGGPGIVERTKEVAGELGQKVSDAASTVKDSLGGAASGAASRASDLGRRAGEWSGSAYDDARRGARRGYEYGRRNVERALDEYPLAATAAALAAGVLSGLLLPGTRREDELMGEEADRLKHQAKEAGQDLLQRGKDVAQATAGAVATEAQRQGLTPASLAEKAKHVAQDVAGAAKDSAKREGLDELPGKAQAVVEHGKEAASDAAERQKEQIRR